MAINIEIFPTMPTRPCLVCLNLQECSVFADFDVDSAGLVFLQRISFDGFGCCHVEESQNRMDMTDSNQFLSLIKTIEPNTAELEKILKKYFANNKDYIWLDALEQHNLL